MTSTADSTPEPQELSAPPGQGSSSQERSAKARLLIQKTHAAFVSKLYAMVADASTDKLISWTTDGDCFKVTDPMEFARDVLPSYFKHGNWQSFVRQLNMYGFHKVNDLAYGGIFGDTQLWMFKHPFFQRGELGKLQRIKRRGPKPATSAAPATADTLSAESSILRAASPATPSSPAAPASGISVVPTEPCLGPAREATPDPSKEADAGSTSRLASDYVSELRSCISDLHQSNEQLRRENLEMRDAVHSCQSAFAGIMGFLETAIVQPSPQGGAASGTRESGACIADAFRRLVGQVAPAISGRRDYPPSSAPIHQPSCSSFLPDTTRNASSPRLPFRSESCSQWAVQRLPPIRPGRGPQSDFSPRVPSLSPPSQATALTSSSAAGPMHFNSAEPFVSRKRRSNSGSGSNSSGCSEVGEDLASPTAPPRIVLPPISGLVDGIPCSQQLPAKAGVASRWHQHQPPLSASLPSSLRETLPLKRLKRTGE